MKTIQMLKKTEEDGSLSLKIPLGTPGTEYEVLVILQHCGNDATTAGQGWPPGYFEKTYGSISDESFQRPTQDDLPQALELE